jgi:hypothetical protein
MTRMAKWLVAAGATLASFVLFLWGGWVAGIRLWPHALHSAADRWVVSAAFATVMGGAVLAWAGWWAGREKKLTSDEQVVPPSVSIQDVSAREGGAAYGVQHGNQYIYHRSPPGEPETSVPKKGGQDGRD